VRTSRALLLAVAALVAAAAVPVPAGAAPASPEFRYVDEDDDAAAAKLLDPLVKKYGSPARCAELLKILRKRPYPAKVDDVQTNEWTCPDGKKRQFTILAPRKASAAKPAGLLIFLHGAVRQPAPGGGAGEASQIAMPVVRDLDFAVIGPSTFDGVEWGNPACRALVHHALRTAKRQFPVDENRVYLAGDSDGGRGAYNIAETEAGALAAAVPVIGSPGGVTRFANLRNLPWFAINGENDSIFDVTHVREAVDGMKASGIDLQWKLVEKGAHDPFFFVKFREEVVAFLKAHVRDPFPRTVHWTLDPSRGDPPGAYLADTFRWIRIDAAGAAASSASFEDASTGLLRADLPRIEAKRDGNRIDVRTSGVTRYSVLVAAEMLDLKKDVEVRTNGKLSFLGKVEPDARVILEEARRFLDDSLLFVNRIAVDVDAAELVPPEAPAPPEGR
jgi:hypothetical protein